MEDNKYRQVHNYYDGNAARVLREMPAYEEEEYPARRQPDIELPQEAERRRERNTPGVKPGVRKKIKRKQKLNMLSVFFLTAAIGVTLYTCIGYLNVQTRIINKNNEIAQLESKLVKMENDNDANLAKIDTSVDLNYIYNYATQKLGMVYPDDKQVIRYKRNVSDYVKQYAEIPAAPEDSLLDKILK